MQSKEVDGLHIDGDAKLYALVSEFLLAHKLIGGSVGSPGTSPLSSLTHNPIPSLSASQGIQDLAQNGCDWP